MSPTGNPRRVLVTGAAGFIGRHVAQRYATQGWQVSGIGHGNWQPEEWQRWGLQSWYEQKVTLENLQVCAGMPEVIVHCAGSGSVGYSLQHPYQDYQRNVASLAEVLEYARLHARQAKIVYPSSAAVYGEVNCVPIAESQAVHPLSPYGSHKLMAEHLCSSYARNFGMAVAVIRFYSVYGNGLRKQLLWDASRKIAAGRHEYFGTGVETRDWLHVRDAAALIQLAAEHADATCPLVNGGSGTGIEVREILRELYHQLGVSAQPVFSGQCKAGDPMHYAADMHKVQGWGWRPLVDWRSGIVEYAAWLKAGAL